MSQKVLGRWHSGLLHHQLPTHFVPQFKLPHLPMWFRRVLSSTRRTRPLLPQAKAYASTSWSLSGTVLKLKLKMKLFPANFQNKFRFEPGDQTELSNLRQIIKDNFELIILLVESFIGWFFGIENFERLKVLKISD